MKTSSKSMLWFVQVLACLIVNLQYFLPWTYFHTNLCPCALRYFLVHSFSPIYARQSYKKSPLHIHNFNLHNFIGLVVFIFRSLKKAHTLRVQHSYILTCKCNHFAWYFMLKIFYFCVDQKQFYAWILVS